MRILFLCSRHNGLSQRAQVLLEELGHHLDIVEVVHGAQMEAAAERFRPDVILAPMLTARIPASIWRHYVCLVVHPGIPGDRGPSALDWAILDGKRSWGVTVLEARDELDGGPIWAYREYPLRDASKSAIYRSETTQAAMLAIQEALERFQSEHRPPFDTDAVTNGSERPLCRQADRQIDWSASSERVLRHIRSADSAPGWKAALAGIEMYLYGAHREGHLRGQPGELLATRDGAVCVACGDGAIWITHARRRRGLRAGDPRHNIKLPIADLLREQLAGVPELPIAAAMQPSLPTWQPIRYREHGDTGYLYFDILNGAMSSAVLQRLLAAYRAARARPTRTLVLCGGEEFWCNGLDLNAIEAAPDPAQASWENILAMNAWVREIVLTDDKRTVAWLRGNAGAGGVMLALAADCVYANESVVLNPHYKGMGGLYGSEYWTYLLPRRVGEATARLLTESLQPIGAARAQRIGLIDGVVADGRALVALDEILAPGNRTDTWVLALKAKAARRQEDESRKPLERFAEEELVAMRRNFFGPDPSYHVARRSFVRKQAAMNGDMAVERA
ncbi:MAG TPA: enoyl-CoA hydratase-related protein [Dyella sp.]|uniref:enoyl-CoA hydratase-related protein n=1 Tax=Dyella sp. TaxID=1869338 RepID=UPI002F95FB10